MKWEIQRYIRDEVISIEGKRHPVNTYLINILGKKKKTEQMKEEKKRKDIIKENFYLGRRKETLTKEIVPGKLNSK